MGWMMTGPCFDGDCAECPDGGCDCVCHDPESELARILALERKLEKWHKHYPDMIEYVEA